MQKVINEEAFEKHLKIIQKKLTNAIAEASEGLMHAMPKKESDIILAFASAFVFANGIALIKTHKMPEEAEKHLISLLYDHVDNLVPMLSEVLKKMLKDGIWEKFTKGEIISLHKEKD